VLKAEVIEALATAQFDDAHVVGFDCFAGTTKEQAARRRYVVIGVNVSVTRSPRR
jgi:hypothetical protein